MAAADNDDTIQPRALSRSGGRSGKQVASRNRAAVDSDQLELLPEGQNIHVQLTTQGSIYNVEQLSTVDQERTW